MTSPRRAGLRSARGVVLHGPRAAPLVERVALALLLKKVAFEWRDPVGGRRDPFPDPGIPTLEIDGERIRGSSLLRFIEERFPEPTLLARDPRTADAQCRLADWVDESFHWYWTRWQQLQLPGTESASHAGSSPGEPPRPAGVSLRDWVARRVRLRPEGEPSQSERLLYEIGHRIDDLARLLADRPFFYSDRIGLADLSVGCALRASRELPGVARQLQKQPRLIAFVGRVEKHAGIGPPG